ncbi:N-acetylmuramoyl-L-alanine amidase family protein [Bacillus sp. Xin1]|uniref:YHYH domain-containing protein n=1 Tax=Bacillus sp. Xin1 TaxID=2740676 RepID=UPI0015742E56|nr:YHYH domain-containing protein [Bacillus sp. Xin1]NSW35891.1 N-acetylmuramoyl-L-alanine amidase family protein [Bacillus sp. Xin1]
MKKNMKILAMAVGLTVMGSTTAAYASPGGLDKNGGHTCRTNCGKYGLATGEYHYHNNWKQENGKWYFYDQSGTKAKGWKEINGTWYYFYNNGQMAANTTIDGYIIGANGAMQKGKAVQTGWQQNGSVWYYYNTNGVKQTGWQQISGVWYYFNGSGAMQTGWQQIGGVWYYFNGSGAMQKDWQQIGGVWYYFNGSGAMQKDWQQIGGVWYYFNGSGAMQKDWQQIGGVWYYFNGSGAMQKSWQQIGGAWYYFNGSGAMQTGWIQENGKWYYLENNGVWNPNAAHADNISQYEGFWSNVDVSDIDDWKEIPTHMSAMVQFISGNKASVGVGYMASQGTRYAEVSGTVTFTNNKAVLNFDDDGWGHSGKIEFTLKNNKVYLNISTNQGGITAWGIPSGQHVLTYQYELEEMKAMADLKK